MNKHKYKHLDFSCVHLKEVRQLHQHKGYDSPAEYCPKTYDCELRKYYLPYCTNCKDYEKG